MRAINLLAPEHEHEFEAEYGLPEALPQGETKLWQGAPDPLALARQALMVDKLLIYFGALIVWSGVSTVYDGGSIGDAGMAVLRMLPLIGLALGLICVIGWLMARTTVYTITDRRIVLRVGVVLSITFNLPYSRIASASLRDCGHGRGDIALTLKGEDRIAYLHLWPHVRPWQLKHTQPMLRAVPDAAAVARTLAGALAKADAAAEDTDMAGDQPMRAVRSPDDKPAAQAIQASAA